MVVVFLISIIYKVVKVDSWLIKCTIYAEASHDNKIMKAMCCPSNHDNWFVVTYALVHIMYHLAWYTVHLGKWCYTIATLQDTTVALQTLWYTRSKLQSIWGQLIHSMVTPSDYRIYRLKYITNGYVMGVKYLHYNIIMPHCSEICLTCCTQMGRFFWNNVIHV